MKDLIVFPEEASVSKVPQCKTGRVIVLIFKSSDRKLFFWMQEPDDSKDDEFLEKLNNYLNNPSAALSSGSGF